MRSWLLPHPLLSLALFVASLLLSSSVAPPSLLLALLLALGAPQIMRTLRIEPVRVRLSSSMPRLMGIVALDIVRSNWAVAQILLGRRRRERVSGFILIPIGLSDRYALAVLAIVLTSTPGTLWVEYRRSERQLLMHVLDLVDEEEWVRLVRDRYEPLLRDIFE